ncbi:MAG: hypothetical protein C0601_06040 [Candidatus Muiribacterium halophilum]|uniref:Amidohydrolase-related domain-containing protein n=1 Tax=Muiribacterium halophilum TaxID=2053465 RepID=A0A2N5ZGW3_MUIH1|nr:MAG: hypothetical protein C0601_06040 [Candidatus Muirbacterium halophilum]
MNNLIIKDLNMFFIEDNNIKHKYFQELYVKDGNICFVAPENTNDFKTLDMQGRAAFHGVVNFHHHIYSQLAKGMPVSGDFSNFYNVLVNMWWKLDKVLFEEAVECSAEIAAVECIKNGVSTVFDHHASFDFIEGSLNKVGRILEKYGIDSCLCFEVSDRNGKEVFERSVDENISYLEQCKLEKNRTAMFGLHAPFTLSDSSLAIIRERTKGEYPMHFHMAEDILDVLSSWKDFGDDIVRRMEKFDLLTPGTLTAHCNHLSETQLNLLSSKNIAIAHNPASNMNNAVGTLGFEKVIDHKGIRFLPGTDGMTADVLSSMKDAFLLYRHNQHDSTIGFELIERMFMDSKKFVDFHFSGNWVFEEGSKANITVFDYIPYTPIDANNFLGHFIYGITETKAYSLINNRLLLDAGKLVGIDEKALCDKAVKVSENLWKKL